MYLVKKNLLSKWYVLQVRTNREFYIKHIIDEFTPWESNALIFTRELLHKKNGNYKLIKMPLFPGYIFIYKEIMDVTRFLRKNLSHEMICPVSFDGEPARVSSPEMHRLLSLAGGDGTFRLSRGINKGEKVIITDGPLKDLKGKILFINEKKRKAKLEISLFNRVLQVSLGIDIHEIDVA